MMYNALPWPSWGAALSPDYTLMMPLNMRSESAYHTNIPNRPNTGNAPDTPVAAANDESPASSSSTTDISATSRPVLLARMTAFMATNQSGGNYSSVNEVNAADTDTAVDNDDELALSDDSLLPSGSTSSSSDNSSSVGSLLKNMKGSPSDRMCYSRLNTSDKENGVDKSKNKKQTLQQQQQHDSGGTTFNPMVVKDDN